MQEYELVEKLPTVREYHRLREAGDWVPVDDEAAARGLPASLYSVCAVSHGEVVGYGRVVGDGAVYFYVQDVVVLPPYRLLGIGRKVMEAVMAYIGAHAREGSFVGLMAAPGVAQFYERYGFRARGPRNPGMGFIWPPELEEEPE